MKHKGTKSRQLHALDEAARFILSLLLSEFRERKLTTSDLRETYKGMPPNELKRRCTIQGISDVDYDLAMKDLDQDNLVKTGPLEHVKNDPHSSLVFVGIFHSKNEYSYLTEDGYRQAVRLVPSEQATRHLQEPPDPAGRMEAITPVSQPQSSPMAHESRRWDVFISHASPDKPYVEPLVKALNDAGVTVWYDKEVLEWGDRLRPKINEGLIKSDYAITVLSKAYLAKRKWTEHELDSLFAREELGQITILPIWHGVVRKDLLEYDPSLADRLAKISETDSYDDIVGSVLRKLGRAAEPNSAGSLSAQAVVWPGGKKSNAIVHAWYDKPGTGEKALLYVRRSPITKDWFVFEESPDLEHHGTRDDVAGRLAVRDRNLRNDGFKRMNFGNASGDNAFDL